MTKSPSELARMEEELEYYKSHLTGQSKSAKEHALREIHKLERQLGLESKPYNSTDF
jgi:hypothetical protein